MSNFSFIQRGKFVLFAAIVFFLAILSSATHAFAANQITVALNESDPVETQSVHFTVTGQADMPLMFYATSRAAGEPCGPTYKSEIEKGATSEDDGYRRNGAFTETVSMDSRPTNGTYVLCVYLQTDSFAATAAATNSATVTTRRQKASLQIATSTAVLKTSDGKYTGAVRLTATGLLEHASRTLYVKVKRAGEPDCGPSLSADQLGFNLGDVYLISGAFTDQVVAGSGATPGKTTSSVYGFKME